MQEFFDSCKMTSYLTGFYLTNGTPTSAETGCLPGTQTGPKISTLPLPGLGDPHGK